MMRRGLLSTGGRLLSGSIKPTPTFTAFRFASSTTAASSSFDPQTVSAQASLDLGNGALEVGDLVQAELHYRKSLVIKSTAIAHYNLGVVQYQSQNLPLAIESFHRSLALSSPPSTSATPPEAEASYPPTPAQMVIADTHTNLGAAYILSDPARPDLALSHLQLALEITPDDGQVCFNLAAVLEATGELEEALVAYSRARNLGVERAAVNERNIAAKLIGKRREEEEAEAANKLKGEGSLSTATIETTSS